MLLFPFAVLGGDLVEPRIALVAAGVYLALVHGLADSAAGLLEVGAVVKAAPAYVGLELREAVLQLLLGYRRQLLHVEGGKARRVGHVGAPGGEDLDVARSVAAAAELFAHVAGLELQPRLQRVQEARLSDARVAGEGADLAAYALAQLVYALARHGAGLNDAVAGSGVDIAQAALMPGIGLVDADHDLAADVLGKGRDPVDEEGVSHRVHLGGYGDEHVDIRHRGPDEEVLPGQQLIHAALAVGVQRDLDPVPHQRRRAVQPETAACPALDRFGFSFDVVEAAQGFDYDALHQSAK